jgi:hypothetical protein
MSEDDWASQFRPGMVSDEKQSESVVEETLPVEAQPIQTLDTDKILQGFEAIVKRLDSLDARLGMYEGVLNNPSWLPAHIDNLRQLHHFNAEAILNANQQFSSLVIRKLDEMEERIKSDDPSYTNVLYSNPELFNEISQRPDENELTMEEEFASQNKIAEMVDDEHPTLLMDVEDSSTIALEMPQVDEPIDIPDEAIDSLLDLQVPDAIREAYSSWREPDADGTWQTFVKAAGGPVAAKKYRTMIEE